MGPPTFPKVVPRIFMVGPPEILFESTRDPGRRSRAMSIFALETNGNERVGTLRFSLWKPSPSALWFFSFKSWWLAGAGLPHRLVLPAEPRAARAREGAAADAAAGRHDRQPPRAGAGDAGVDGGGLNRAGGGRLFF